MERIITAHSSENDTIYHIERESMVVRYKTDMMGWVELELWKKGGTIVDKVKGVHRLRVLCMNVGLGLPITPESFERIQNEERQFA